MAKRCHDASISLESRWPGRWQQEVGMDKAEGDVSPRAAGRNPFRRWQAGRRRRQAALRSVRDHEGALAANLGLAGEVLFDRLAGRDGIVLPVASSDEARRRWLYAEPVESRHYGEGVSYLLVDTDADARSLLEEPKLGALYPDYEEACFRLNALSPEDAVAVRDAGTSAEADIDSEQLRSAVRAWFERAATTAPS